MRPDTKRQILYDSTYTGYLVKIIKMEIIMVVAKSWRGQENKELLFNRFEFQFYERKSYGDGWYRWLQNNVNVFNTTELYT